MPPTLIGYGVPDYSKFSAGAPVLLMVSRYPDQPSSDGSIYAGRLLELFRPGLALLMQPGPMAGNLAPQQDGVTVTHLMTSPEMARQPPEAVRLSLPPSKGSHVTIAIDNDKVVESIEAGPPKWPVHLSIMKRIHAIMADAYGRHQHNEYSLMYR